MEEKNVEITKDGEILKKVKIDRVYSEEIGLYVTDFHYRFEKELGIGKNYETGELCEAYAKVTIQYKEPIAQDTLKSWHESRAPLHNSVHDYTDEELCLITPISREEYESATKGE